MPLLEVTPKAVERIRASMEREGRPGASLRIAVLKGGCSGYEYQVGFVDEPALGDLEIAVQGLRVLIAEEHHERLAGTVLDWADGMYGAGLRFRNPNASHQCGCGASFGIEDS